MAEQKWLSAAECAARTGVTVRTLHVYEREGLLSPPRSESGWRQYGHAELAALSAITSLKELGLTLAQIRMVMCANPPPLGRLLQTQRQVWAQRHSESLRALELLARAQRRMSSDQPLSVDELCELVRELEANRSPDMQNTHALIREIINESLSAEEERSWNTWFAQHPGDLAQRRDFAASLRPLYEALNHLAEQQADPASPEAQALVKRKAELLTLHGSRERMLRQLEWNPAITFKFYGMGAKIFSRKQDGATPPVLSPSGLRFLNAATGLSASARDFAELIRDVQKLMLTGADPSSPGAARLMQCLEEICRLHALGDPFIYVQWRQLSSRINPEAAALAFVDDDALAFMARAMGNRDGRRPADFPGPPDGPATPAAADRDRLTPDELYDLKRWFAERPADQSRASQAFAEAHKALLVELEALARQGISPQAEAAQTLAQRYNIAMLQHGMRELTERAVAFNRTIMVKVRRTVEKSQRANPGKSAALSFLQAALRASSWGQSMARIHRDVQQLISSGVDPTSPRLDDLVQELHQLCLDHSLGEPGLYARHACFLASVAPDHTELVCGDEQTWDFLARAIQARDGL